MKKSKSVPQSLRNLYLKYQISHITYLMLNTCILYPVSCILCPDVLHSQYIHEYPCSDVFIYRCMGTRYTVTSILRINVWVQGRLYYQYTNVHTHSTLGIKHTLIHVVTYPCIDVWVQVILYHRCFALYGTRYTVLSIHQSSRTVHSESEFVCFVAIGTQ